MPGVSIYGLRLAARYNTPQNSPTGARWRAVSVPDDPVFMAALGEVTAILANPDVWLQTTGITALEAASLMSDIWRNPMLGVIVAYVTLDPPDGVLPCDGTAYERADYPYLYEVLDPEFIDTETSFHTPDLSGLFLLGSGPTYEAFTEGGAEAVALSEDELPSHSHSNSTHQHTTHGHMTVVGVSPGEVPFNTPGLPDLTGVASVGIGYTGGNEAHENMPPYFAVKYGMVAR
jgi:microcystin-dependent protein